MAQGAHVGRNSTRGRFTAQRFRLGRHSLGWPCLVVVLALLALARPADAQIDRTVPGPDYDLAMAAFHAGEFVTAAEGFQDAARAGIRTPDGRWIDSICYYSMTGECLYQQGNLPEALAQFEAALKLYLLNSNWMLSISFPKTVSAASTVPQKRINWGKTARKTTLGDIPERTLSFQGRIDNTGLLRTGGVVRPSEYVPVRSQEVVRCTALALRRRRELLGPACVYSPLTAQLSTALAARAALPNHWSQTWANLQLGLGYAAAGKNPQAITALKSSLLASGSYEHALTSTALLELGKLAFIERSYTAAGSFFLEATFSAAMFDQFDVMEEAFRWGLITHLVSGAKAPYPPLANAALWADKWGSPMLDASLHLLLAENHAALGQTAPAAAALAQAQRTMARREMAVSAQLGARLHFQTAQVEFLQGKIAAGDAALTTAIKAKRAGSLRLFQIALVDKWFTAGALSPRATAALFDETLREPAAADWSIDALDTFAVAATPNLVAMEHWFLHTLIERKDVDKALDIGDRIRRKRFYTTLPYGGRLLALRWILGAPRAALSDRAMLQQQDLLVRYPAYRELIAQSNAAQEALAALPLSAETDAQKQEQQTQFTKLANVSTLQEGLLRTIAVQREPSDFVFPPLVAAETFRKSLGDKRIAIVFLATSQDLFGFAVSKKEVHYWRVQNAAKLRDTIGALLKSIGLRDRNQPLSAAQLKDDAWRSASAKLLEQLTGDRTGKVWEPFEEVVIVPDGPLWYVPFEALLTPGEEGPEPLISKLQVRYAPTISLAMPDARGRTREAVTAVVAGRLYPRDTDEPALSATRQIEAVLPRTSRLPENLPAPSGLFAKLCGRLVVLDDIEDHVGAAYEWSPMQIDRGKPGSALGNWFTLPWGGPDTVVLPGFHTTAETGLRDPGGGEDIFLTICGMMSTGTRTVLLSRWRTAGRTSHELVREFVQELPHTDASAAWQRSVYLLMHSDLAADVEPRVQLPPLDSPLAADHPFFWAGYLLADNGTQPRTDEAPVDDKPDPAAPDPAPGPIVPALIGPPDEKLPGALIPGVPAPGAPGAAAAPKPERP
ncbi:MAG: CHAT domain-containing protein [Pirellulaceae bacterium]